MNKPYDKKLRGRQTQCQVCFEYFNSLKGFEGHRYGKYAPINRPDTRKCRTPEELRAKGWAKNLSGFWITSKMPTVAVAKRAGAAIEVKPRVG